VHDSYFVRSFLHSSHSSIHSFIPFIDRLQPKEEDTVISSSIMNYTGPAGGRRKARMGAIKFDPSQIEELGGEQGELPAKSVKEVWLTCLFHRVLSVSDHLLLL